MEPDVDHSVDPLLNVTLPLDGRTVPPVVTHISRLPRRPVGFARARGRSRPAPPSAPTASTSATSRAATGPLALCFHGFPDSAHTWRHLLPSLAEAGFRAVAPFQRGYAPTAVPADGLFQSGALSMDAIALHEALGGDERRRARRPRLGRADRVRRRRARARPVAQVVAMAVPPGRRARARLRHEPRAAEAVLVHVLLPAPAGRPARRPPTTSRSSTCCGPTGRRASTPPRSWRLLKPSLRDPANLQAALGYYRARLGDGRNDPALDAVQAATQEVPPQPTLYLHGADDGCIGVEVAETAARRHGRPTTSPSRSSTAAGHFLHLEQPDEVNRRIVDSELPDGARDRLPARPAARRPGRGREAGLRDLPGRRPGPGSSWPAGPEPLTVYVQDDLVALRRRWRPRDDTDLAVSWHHDIETVPTLLRVERGRGARPHRRAGAATAWEELTGRTGLGPDLPPMRPGCGSLSVDPNLADELAVRFGGSTLRARRVELAELEDEVEALFDRGWTDGLPVVPPTEARVLRMLEGTSRAAGRGRGRRPARPHRRHGREGGHQRGHGGLPARVPAVGPRRGRGGLHRRVQHARGAGHHHAGRAGHRRQRSRARSPSG